jgi:hypothetical protein
MIFKRSRVSGSFSFLNDYDLKLIANMTIVLLHIPVEHLDENLWIWHKFYIFSYE